MAELRNYVNPNKVLIPVREGFGNPWVKLIGHKPNQKTFGKAVDGTMALGDDVTFEMMEICEQEEDDKAARSGCCHFPFFQRKK